MSDWKPQTAKGDVHQFEVSAHMKISPSNPYKVLAQYFVSPLESNHGKVLASVTDAKDALELVGRFVDQSDQAKPSPEELAEAERVEAVLEAALTYRSAHIQREAGAADGFDVWWVKTLFLQAVERYQKNTTNEAHQEIGDLHIARPLAGSGILLF